MGSNSKVKHSSKKRAEKAVKQTEEEKTAQREKDHVRVKEERVTM